MALINLPEPKPRNLFLADQVTQASMNELSKAIISINEDDENLKKLYKSHDLEYKAKPIKLYIDSYGGAVYQCFGLIGIMETSKTPIHTIVTGCAMSCGFIILIHGHQRFAYKHATPLYHQVSTGFRGKLADMEENIKETRRLQEKIEGMTLNLTKISKKKLEKIFKRKIDWSMNAEEALKLGVIDEIIK
jgi:ATP-dependent Clp protease, protease subunit